VLGKNFNYYRIYFSVDESALHAVGAGRVAILVGTCTLSVHNYKRWTFAHLNPYSPTTCEKKLAKFLPSYGRSYGSAHMPCLDSDPQPIEVSSFPPHSRCSISCYGRVPRPRDLCTGQVSFPFFTPFCSLTEARKGSMLTAMFLPFA